MDPRIPRTDLYEIERADFTNPVLSQDHNLVINLANTGRTEETDREEQKEEIPRLAETLNMDAFINTLSVR